MLLSLSLLVQREKQNAKNTLDKFPMQIFVTYFVQTASSECS